VGLIKTIQKLLNSNGLYSSYTELRRFPTSVANHDIEHINGDRYIPSWIRPIAKAGHLIQEGSDNIDINAETVDGKNTFHSLARAVFQFKSVDELAVCAERINRGRDSYLLSEKRPGVTVVAYRYPPIIDAKPIDMSTVLTAMKKCLDMSLDAGQEHSIQEFDQQLYAIAQQVKWSRPDILISLIPTSSD